MPSGFSWKPNLWFESEAIVSIDTSILQTFDEVKLSFSSSFVVAVVFHCREL